MNRTKIIEQVVTVILSMVFTAFGGATVWGITTIMQHDRIIVTKTAEIQVMRKELELARERDKELITMMAEEIKKLQSAVEATCSHLEEEADKRDDEKYEEFQVRPVPQPIPKPEPKKEPSKTFNKFFPPEQRTEDYQRILRDKFEQRTKGQEQIRQ